MRNLLIDIGNSTAKFAFSDKSKTQLSDIERISRPELSKKLEAIFLVERFLVTVVCSTSGIDDDLENILERGCEKLIILKGDTEVPIKNQYETPDTLGPDRLAAAVGAEHLFPGEKIIVFDFGTALTVDFISKKGEFKGGNISPGLHTRFKSLNRYTTNLPLLENGVQIKDLGQNTVEAINTGVTLGLIFEVEGYLKKYSDHKIIFTGGDAIFFAERTKYPIFVVCNLVLIGLFHIANKYATY